MKGYINKIFSLEEKASAQVAINLCQSESFKEVALGLEKPTYGTFLPDHPSYVAKFFLTDEETLSVWDKVKDDKRRRESFLRSLGLGDEPDLTRWRAAVNQQCLRLIEGTNLPIPLKQRVRPFVERIASEYLTYGRRQEELFGVSRYLLMDVLTVGDWNSVGRIDEGKVARRLLEDERPTLKQKYVIACVYCVREYIEQLWSRFSLEERTDILGNEYKLCEESFLFVSLWSLYMSRIMEECKLWATGVTVAIHCGNRSALMVCWGGLEEPVRHQILIDNALDSLKHWQNVENYIKLRTEIRRSKPIGLNFIEKCTLLSRFSELTVFLLSQMDREQRMAFFEKAFRSRRHDESVTKFLLDWPYQDDFLPSMNQLWSIMPMDEYERCVMALAEKYAGDEGNANRDYDYGSLLRALWEGTPEAYRKYVACSRKSAGFSTNKPETLPSRLLMKSPFPEKDQELFKLIFRDLPQEKRREMMLTNSKEGELVSLHLIREGNLSFLNWLLKECLAEEEIASFKKQIVTSCMNSILCMELSKNDYEMFVEDLFRWSSEEIQDRTEGGGCSMEGERKRSVVVDEPDVPKKQLKQVCDDKGYL